MATLNKVFLIGNTTREPELRVTPKGTSICQLGIAINRTFKTEDGTVKDDVTFVDLEAWGKTAEIISKYVNKGDPLMIEGRLKLDQWVDQQTNTKRSKLKVVVENVQFLRQRRDGDGEPAQSTADQGQAQAAASARAAGKAFDEDIPF